MKAFEVKKGPTGKLVFMDFENEWGDTFCFDFTADEARVAAAKLLEIASQIPVAP